MRQTHQAHMGDVPSAIEKQNIAQRNRKFVQLRNLLQATKPIGGSAHSFRAQCRLHRTSCPFFSCFLILKRPQANIHRRLSIESETLAGY